MRTEVVSEDMGAGENGAKAWARKKTFFASFPTHLLENALVKFVFPYTLSAYHEGAKQNTIRVTRGASAKLSHCTILTLI
jgi:hypothetical protein